MVVASQQQIYQPNYSAQPGLTKRILYISIEDKSAQSAITERTWSCCIPGLVASWLPAHAVVVHIGQVVAVDELALGTFL